VYFRGDGFVNEIKGINAANSFAPIGNITTPKVLKVFPEYNAIITEFVRMRDSRSAFRGSFISKSKINWKDVGTWLRNFHDSEISSSQNKTFIEHKIQKSSEQLEKFSPLFSDDQIKNYKIKTRTAKADLRDHSLEWVFSHGDFHTGNIQISGKSTYIIDFENTTMTPRGYEVIYFLSCLEATIHFLFRKRKFRCLESEFLKGYGMEFSPNPSTDYFYLIGKLDMIAYYHKRFNTTRNKLLKLIFSFLEKEIAKSLPPCSLRSHRSL